MKSIYIPSLLKAPNKMEEVCFQERLSDLETLTPVQAVVKVTHGGNFLQVAGSAETIITLTCDRCLNNYNHRLTTDASEIIWLEAPTSIQEPEPERELSVDDLVETLSPMGHFRPDEWIYEQLCLAIPQRKLCDGDCSGITWASASENPVDSRWASLEKFKENLLN
ncbi:MAG: DUF177 domain-containing protein [Elainellaceae cyanobacterium]